MSIISITVGKNPMEEMEEPSKSTRESEKQYLNAILKRTEWFWFISKANHKHHSNPSLFLNHWSWRSRSWPFLWRPRPSRTNTQKRCPFHHRGLECKLGSQEILGVTGKFGLGVQNEARQRLTEFCQEKANVLF